MKFEGARARNFVEQKKNCSYFGIFWVSGGCKKNWSKIGFPLNWSSHPSGIPTVKRLLKFHESPHIVGQLYGVPHGILRVINTILYENEFQNPQVFHLHVRFSPERSTVVLTLSLKLKSPLSKISSCQLLLKVPGITIIINATNNKTHCWIIMILNIFK
jgi:hypothetical protein